MQLGAQAPLDDELNLSLTVLKFSRLLKLIDRSARSDRETPPRCQRVVGQNAQYCTLFHW